MNSKPENDDDADAKDGLHGPADRFGFRHIRSGLPHIHIDQDPEVVENRNHAVEHPITTRPIYPC